MAAPRKRPGDFTGRETERLETQVKQDKADREAELSLITAKKKRRRTGVVDLSQSTIPVFEEEEYDEEEDDVEYVESPDATRVITMAATLEQFTFGVGNTYELLEEGQQYRLPKAVADHLHRQGYVWGR
jgi:hypothetical protein